MEALISGPSIEQDYAHLWLGLTEGTEKRMEQRRDCMSEEQGTHKSCTLGTRIYRVFRRGEEKRVETKSAKNIGKII